MKIALTVNIWLSLHSVAERTTRGYFGDPRVTEEGSLPPAGKSLSSLYGPQHHGQATIEERGVDNSDIAGFTLPQDTRQQIARESKPARDGDNSAIYGDDHSAIYNTDGGAAYKQDSVSQSRSDGSASGFMGDDMHQNLMAKIREASAHAFDGVEQHSRLKFGPSSAGLLTSKGSSESAPSYKPVYEALSRQPDPRPHPGQRPSPLQPEDSDDYRANRLDDSHRGEGYRDDGAYQDRRQPYDAPESVRSGDYPHQGDYQGTPNADNYGGRYYGGEDDGSRGENYRGGDYRKEAYKEDDYRGNDHPGGDRKGEGDYRGGDYDAEGVIEDGYAAFDPYKEAAQEEEAYRAVEGESDRFGEYSRSHGDARYPDRGDGTRYPEREDDTRYPDREDGTRYPDREDPVSDTRYPSRYEESVMNRGYTRNDDGYSEYQREGRRDEEVGNQRNSYHGNQNNQRSDRHGNEEFGRGDYDDNPANERNRYYGNHENEHNGHRSKREVSYGKGIEGPDNQHQKRGLESPDKVVVFTEEVRNIHPVIHRHYEGIPPPTKITQPLSKEIPSPVGKISQISAGATRANAGSKTHASIFRGPSLLIARPALPALDADIPDVQGKAQKAVYPEPLSPAHAHTASGKPGQGQTIPGAVKVEVLQNNEDTAQILSFTPGVIHTGFIPMIPLHHISKRSLTSRTDGLMTADPAGSPENDLHSAGSRRRAVYQPHYDDYGRQQGRQNAETEDPYERYLPREDDKDPYFR